jgi:hypothetical protein
MKLINISLFFLFFSFNVINAQYQQEPIKVQLEIVKQPLTIYEAWNKGVNDALDRNYKQSIIQNENRRIELEEERQEMQYAEQQRLYKLELDRIQEQKKKNEENDPNSILNKARNNNLKLENEELKNKLKHIELLLLEKENKK